MKEKAAWEGCKVLITNTVQALNWTIFNIPHILHYDSTLLQEMDFHQIHPTNVLQHYKFSTVVTSNCTLSHNEVML